MNTPTLPHVSVPHVSVPHVNLPHLDVSDVTDRLSDRAGDVGGLVTDAWSGGRDIVQDLAAAAVDVIEDLPDKAIALAGAVIPALRPTKQRSWRPFALVAAAVGAFVVVAWYLKKRRAGAAEPYAESSAAPSQAGVSAAS